MIELFSTFISASVGCLIVAVPFVIRNENRLTTLETNYETIAKTLERIEKKIS